MIIPDNLSFEQLVLDEIGLEFSQNNQLIDQDTRNIIMISSKPITREATGYGYKFDPLRNPKLMGFLFSYFANKLLSEQYIYIDVVYYKTIKNSRNSPLAVKADGTEYVSKVYSLESLKYLDLICQLNGGTDVDLSRYDITDT